MSVDRIFFHYLSGTKRNHSKDRLHDKDHKELHSLKYGNFVPASTNSPPIEKQRILDETQSESVIEGIECSSNDIYVGN